MRRAGSPTPAIGLKINPYEYRCEQSGSKLAQTSPSIEEDGQHDACHAGTYKHHRVQERHQRTVLLLGGQDGVRNGPDHDEDGAPCDSERQGVEAQHGVALDESLDGCHARPLLWAGIPSTSVCYERVEPP